MNCVGVCASVLVIAVLSGCTRDPVSTEGSRSEAPSAQNAPVQNSVSEDGTVVGQVLLPGTGGRRGLEIHAWFIDANGTERQLWILPEDDGRFERSFSGVLTRARVVAGSYVQDLQLNQNQGIVDLGMIDLRERLVVCPIRVRSGDEVTEGDVRVGLWIGQPHTGPQGEFPSLGSKQFPTHAIGQSVEWVLPPDVRDVYFLVERPDGPARGTSWRTGAQQLFGPFESSSFPIDLILD